MATVFSKNTFTSVIEGWKIHPENNVVPADDLKRLEKNKFFKAQKDLGNYDVKGTSSDDKPHTNPANNDITRIVDEIRLMTVSEAKKSILGDGTENNHGLLDIYVLKKLISADPRTGVQTACQSQINVLFARDKKE